MAHQLKERKSFSLPGRVKRPGLSLCRLPAIDVELMYDLHCRLERSDLRLSAVVIRANPLASGTATASHTFRSFAWRWQDPARLRLIY